MVIGVRTRRTAAAPTCVVTRRWSSAWPTPLRPDGAARLCAAQREWHREHRDEDERRRPGQRAEQSQHARRPREHHRCQQQVSDRPPAGPPLDAKLEVRDRPQEDGDHRDEQQAQAAGNQPAEQRGGDPRGGGHGVAREPEVGARRSEDADRPDAAERELRGHGAREPDRRGEPSCGRHDRLHDGEADDRRPIDLAEDGQPPPTTHQARDHRTSSRS